ncbi:MAG: peroxiredoxin [Pseudomonadales bacterium]|nr:peroxiredoxin [Pseudomonadales bacterium]MBO6563488.1 peroxiredoxin [Pseudomonadales bacterium]MBO6597780.1 peroxiredoxin [Pseudomonadales bacterium]MBO6655934.1 peroxiredoxin [Pseudomonadales bacterium]MBO6824018.1 peroxiredoxin [Pseudomonadales bacterium]
MTVQVGDSIPEVTMKIMGDQGPQDISTADIFSGKKVVLFAVPGAFTPTCSAAHLPGFVASADKIKEKGVDAIVCVSVNDAFVMDAWGKGQNAEEIMMVGDGNGEFTKAMGVEMDGSGFGLGTRSIRYSLIAEDGKITALNLEKGGAFEVSSAETIMEAL